MSRLLQLFIPFCLLLLCLGNLSTITQSSCLLMLELWRLSMLTLKVLRGWLWSLVCSPKKKNYYFDFLATPFLLLLPENSLYFNTSRDLSQLSFFLTSNSIHDDAKFGSLSHTNFKNYFFKLYCSRNSFTDHFKISKTFQFYQMLIDQYCKTSSSLCKFSRWITLEVN